MADTTDNRINGLVAAVTPPYFGYATIKLLNRLNSQTVYQSITSNRHSSDS